MCRELLEALRAACRPDGGWPYYAGKSSRLEPTCWALLALRAAGERVSADVLSAWPRRDRLLADRPGGNINYAFNGLAAIVLAAFGVSDRALLDGLIAARAVALPESTVNRQDNSIQAWSWTDGTFSWVEPTAWVLAGVKRLGAGTDISELQARIADAERLLADRVCQGGGWNHGNSNMLGLELAPYVSVTALALLALSDKPSHPGVAPSLAWLERNRFAESSAMALGLTRIALGVFNREAGDVEDALATEWRETRFLENIHLIALALYALAGAGTGFGAFCV